jgi:hypothetical protein
LWLTFAHALAGSGVPPDRLFFYLADEPTVRDLPDSVIAAHREIGQAILAGGLE